MTKRTISSSRTVAGYSRLCQSSGVPHVEVSLHAAHPLTNGVKPYFLVFEGKTARGNTLTHLEYAGEADLTFGCGYTPDGKQYHTPREFGQAVTRSVANALGSIPRSLNTATLDAEVLSLLNERAAALLSHSPEELTARYLKTLE